jgi:hypothetical protein
MPLAAAPAWFWMRSTPSLLLKIPEHWVRQVLNTGTAVRSYDFLTSA